MNLIKILGIVLMLLGVVLIFWGFQESGSIGPKVVKTVTTVNADKVMWLYIGGAVSFFVGLAFFIKRV
jgi:hypothetical protein